MKTQHAVPVESKMRGTRVLRTVPALFKCDAKMITALAESMLEADQMGGDTIYGFVQTYNFCCASRYAGDSGTYYECDFVWTTYGEVAKQCEVAKVEPTAAMYRKLAAKALREWAKEKQKAEADREARATKEKELRS
jgi:hypothetical protein